MLLLAVWHSLVVDVLVDGLGVGYRLSVISSNGMLDQSNGTSLTSKALSNLIDPLWPEGTLCVKDSNLPIGTTKALGKLCHDTHGVRDLGLAASKLAEHLTDAPRFKPAAKDLVKCLAAGTDLEARLALLSELSSCHEAGRRILSIVSGDDTRYCWDYTHATLFASLFDLLDFDIGEAFDGFELLTNGILDELVSMSVKRGRSVGEKRDVRRRYGSRST